MALNDQLEKIRVGKSKKLRGLQVTRTAEDEFSIDGFGYSASEAIDHLNSHGVKKTGGGVDYDNVVFLLIKPGKNLSISKVLSTHQIKNRTEHQKLLRTAVGKRCVLYYAGVENRNGKYFAVQPWLVDWDSIDAIYGTDDDSKPTKEKTKSGLFCPYCDHQINSTPGRTLHVKSKHPNKLEEYKEWLKSHGKN